MCPSPINSKGIQKKPTDVGLEKWRLIALQFTGRCIHCEKIIPKGKKAEWFKGVGVRHEKCAQLYIESKKLEYNAIMALLIDDNQSASKLAKEAFDLYPYHESEFYKLGDYLFDTNEFRKAIHMYDKILKNNPTSYEVLLDKGAAFSWIDERAKALKCYNLALKSKPNDIEALDRIQSHYSLSGQHSKSIKILRKILRLKPKDPSVYMQKLANAYYTIGDFENALKTNKKLSAVTSHPIYTMLDREDYLIRLIDEEHSEKDVLSKINKHLKNDDSVFIDLIMLRFYHRFDKERESEVIYKKIKELKPANDYQIVKKSNFYFQMKSYAKCIEFCKEHLDNKKTKPHMLYIMALAHSQKKDYPGAIKSLTALIESNKEANIETPNEIFNLLAENLERTNAFDLALGGSEMVLKNSYGRNKEALQRIIRLLKKTGRESQTMPYLENFHKINPSNNTVSLEYVTALMENKQFFTALDIITEVEKSLDSSSDDITSVLLKKATCLFHIGEISQAFEIFKNLAKKDKNLKDALDGVALTSIRLGKIHDAQKAIKASEKIVSELAKEPEKPTTTSFFSPRVKNTAPERVLKKGKNIITKPTFRYNPEKKIPDNSIAKTALNSIVALFNSHGGILQIGITDKKPTGIESDLKVFAKNKRTPEELENYIKKTVKQRLSEPELEKFISFTFPKIKSKVICEMVIPHSVVPIFVKSQNKDEEFYVLEAGKATRLGPKQQIKYIKENFEELN